MRLAAADQANQELVDRLIAEGALWSPALIAAFRATPRHQFLDRVFVFQRKQERWKEIITRDPGPEELRILYSDQALITHLGRRGRGQPDTPVSSSSQPSLMAQMLEDLQLAPGLRVLEVGAGTGYNAALIAHVVGPGNVTSVDVDRSVLSEAWDHLRKFPERDVRLQHADGRHGYADAAPHDRIMVTAATPDLEPDWLEQLADGGLVLAPLVFAPGLAFIVCGSVDRRVFEGRLTRAAYFMPLRAEGETGPVEAPPLPPHGEGRITAAPWAGWFERRRPRAWLSFSQSLAFYGFLKGLTIYHQIQSNGQAVFGISAADAGPPTGFCWLGPREWQWYGDAGEALARDLWRCFLDAGAPWPSEYRLRIGVAREIPRTGRRHEFVRHGPRCQQVWEVSQARQRPGWL